MSRNSQATPKPLVGGQMIPVGTADGWGPLMTGLSCLPLGTATLAGEERPGIFVRGRSGYEPGVYFYHWVDEDENGTPVFGKRRAVGEPFGDRSICTIYQKSDGTVCGLWFIEGTIRYAVLDTDSFAFVPAGKPTKLLGWTSGAVSPENPLTPYRQGRRRQRAGCRSAPRRRADGLHRRPRLFERETKRVQRPGTIVISHSTERGYGSSGTPTARSYVTSVDDPEAGGEVSAARFSATNREVQGADGEHPAS